MKIFKDNAGRTWTISITVYAIKRVRAILSIDLYGLVDEKFEGLSRLMEDPVNLVDVLYVLCQDQCEKTNVSDEDFGRGMAGDVIARASEAFLEELTDFFPDPRVRAGLKKVLEASEKVRSLMLDQMVEEFGSLDATAVAETLMNSSGNSPALSELTRDHSRSANSSKWRKGDRKTSGNTRRRSSHS